MYAIAQTFALKPGCYAEYKKAHDELWPEIVAALKENSVSMIIHYYDDRLFLYATAPDRDAFKRSHTGDVMDRWEKYMATMMITGSDGSAVVGPLETAFTFGDFSQHYTD